MNRRNDDTPITPIAMDRWCDPMDASVVTLETATGFDLDVLSPHPRLDGEPDADFRERIKGKPVPEAIANGRADKVLSTALDVLAPKDRRTVVQRCTNCHAQFRYRYTQSCPECGMDDTLQDVVIQPAYLLKCQACGHFTTLLEATERDYNKGRCEPCGGTLKVAKAKPRLRLHVKLGAMTKEPYWRVMPVGLPPEVLDKAAVRWGISSYGAIADAVMRAKLAPSMMTQKYWLDRYGPTADSGERYRKG